MPSYRQLLSDIGHCDIDAKIEGDNDAADHISQPVSYPGGAFMLLGGALLYARPAHAGQSSNGITANGITLNGMFINGITTNGITTNGLTENGISFNGMQLQGCPMNDLFLNGTAAHGASYSSQPFPSVQNEKLPWATLSHQGLEKNAH